MPRTHLLSIALLSALVLSACGGSGAPSFPSDYADRLQAAWDSAGRGENPTHGCSVVVGLAVGRAGSAPAARSDAAQAFQVCYVDVSARYVEARLAASPGEESCANLAGHIMIARMSLGGFAGEVGLDRAQLDRQLADRIGARIRQNCPQSADSILGS
ncbi:MAG: hypothetical protein KF823_01425 [Xanthomonadales bacterium]|nr:hypothetical protein [Xanthomonadales bacterium]